MIQKILQNIIKLFKTKSLLISHKIPQWLPLGKKTKIYGRNLIKSHFFIKFLP